MRYTFFFLFSFLLTGGAYAQAFKFPDLPPQGKITSLVPSNWKIIDSVSGDLNHDGIKDLALILEFYRPVKESRAYGDNTTEIITEIQKPRILAIYFRRSASGSYKLVTQNNNFINNITAFAAGNVVLLPVIIVNLLLLNILWGNKRTQIK